MLVIYEDLRARLTRIPPRRRGLWHPPLASLEDGYWRSLILWSDLESAVFWFEISNLVWFDLQVVDGRESNEKPCGRNVTNETKFFLLSAVSSTVSSINEKPLYIGLS